MNELFDALGRAAVAADAGAGRGGRGAARSMGQANEAVGHFTGITVHCKLRIATT